MNPERSLQVARNCVLCLVAIGALMVGYVAVWTPARHASLIDVILTPVEVRDPAKVELVYRSLRRADNARAALGMAGIAVAGLSGLALFLLTRRPTPPPMPHNPPMQRTATAGAGAVESYGRGRRIGR